MSWTCLRINSHQRESVASAGQAFWIRSEAAVSRSLAWPGRRFSLDRQRGGESRPGVVRQVAVRRIRRMCRHERSQRGMQERDRLSRASMLVGERPRSRPDASELIRAARGVV